MRPLRYLGVVSMPIHPDGLSIVVMLCASRSFGGIERIEPVGTGFFVGVPGTAGIIHWYVVTARHVVVHATAMYGQLYVRVRLTEGLQDIPITEADWVKGRSIADDIAVLPFPWRNNFRHRSWSSETFLSDEDDVPYAGELVYFLGLLNFIPEMGANNVPMVRSGTLGAFHQTDIPVVMPDRVRTKVYGHLIDCRAYRGFSGSPCFVQDPFGKTRLLGVVSAHFDAKDYVPLVGDAIEGMSAEVPIHAGIGVVAPVELLSDLLANERLVKMRKRIEDDAEQINETEPATADTLVPETPGEFKRFENLTRKLVEIPKKELDEKRKDES